MPTALNDLVKATSRSFYLTLRMLPARVPPPAGAQSFPVGSTFGNWSWQKPMSK